MVARRLVVVMCIASCKPVVSVEAPRNHTQVPTARLAIAGGNTVRIVRVDGGKLTVEQTTQLPDEVDALFWVGKDPAVWLVADAMGMREGHVNEMGLVTATGYVAFPPVEWPDEPQPSGWEDMGASRRDAIKLVATDDGELWQLHCAWWG